MSDERVGHFGGRRRDGDAGVAESFDLGRSCALATADDRTGVTHAASGRCRGTSDEGGDGLLTILLRPSRCFFLSGTTDLTDHDDGFGLRVVVEHFEHVEVRGAVDGIATDTDAGALTVAAGGELPDGLVGQGAGAGDDADVALLVNVARGDADAAPAVGLVTRAGRDEAGAVRADEAGLAAFDSLLDLDHVIDGDAFGDTDDEVEALVDAFEDGVSGKGRWNENDGDCGSGFFHGLIDGVKDRYDVGEKLTAFARSDAGHDLCAVIEAELCVTSAKAASDALDEDAGFRSNEDGHIIVMN